MASWQVRYFVAIRASAGGVSETVSNGERDGPTPSGLVKCLGKCFTNCELMQVFRFHSVEHLLISKCLQPALHFRPVLIQGLSGDIGIGQRLLPNPTERGRGPRLGLTLPFPALLSPFVFCSGSCCLLPVFTRALPWLAVFSPDLPTVESAQEPW